MNALPNLGGCTPADLQDMGMSNLMYPDALALTTSDRSADSLSASQHGVPPSGGPIDPQPLTLTPVRELRASMSTLRNPDKSGVKSRRAPRSKGSRLPPDIQLSLNTMLAANRPYVEIIHWLANRGHPGFNKVNLHNWRITGFQLWLRATHPTTQSSIDPEPSQLSEQINLGPNPSVRGDPAVL